MTTTETTLFVGADVWDEEYSKIKAIPSSTRQEPAKALVLFSDLLGLKDGKKILDAGCGNGRNSVFLAKRGCEITAVDFSSEAISETKRRSQASGVESKVRTMQCFIGENLLIEPGTFDAAIDCYTFCHFIDEPSGRKFWKDVARVMRPGGHVFSVVFSPEDEYYAQFVPGSKYGEKVVMDPSNHVIKRLYEEEEIKGYFSGLFERLFFAKFEFLDMVHGKEFRRVVLISVLKARQPA